jgi:N utilization substance protein B
MTRSVAREIAMRIVFALSEGGPTAQRALEHTFDGDYYASLKGEDEAYASRPSKRQADYIERVVIGVQERAEELNDYIGKYAVGRRPDRISRVASAIIKTAMYEVMYMPDVPNAAAINDAVEMSKRYETPETTAYINGVLGSFSLQEQRAEEA